ncbi:DUF916 and DUF3324 domain-containing protein [Vagococcus jeotgali]|uniref:DUF916 and DUF3324 domain-containing protein n=1 Tax=Vagococcus jeotgali TaxID=3109030 RepID=UPI002DDC311D|nr:DUF916 and DUF3324 domain-containing protein [Vagococcus sp. B2T-5]
MKKLIKRLFFLVALISLSAVTAQAVDREEGIGFQIKPVFNSNQIDPSVSYFYTKVEPGQEQKIEVIVESNRKAPATLAVEVLDAYTGNKGTIAYGTQEKIGESDPTLKNPVSQLVKPETEKLTVQDFERKVVTFTITPPAEKFEGVKMGSIRFMLVDEDEDAAMKNNIALETGLILASNGEQFNNGKDLKMNGVKAELVRGQKMVIANLQNPEPKTLEGLTIDARLKDKKSGKIIKNKKINGAAMAPNSNFDFEMAFGLQELPTGQFIYEMKVNNDFYNWDFKEEFEITGAQAKKINNESAFNIDVPLWIKVVTGVQVLLVIIILVMIIVRRKGMSEQLKRQKRKGSNRKHQSGRKKSSSRKGGA